MGRALGIGPRETKCKSVSQNQECSPWRLGGRNFCRCRLFWRVTAGILYFHQILQGGANAGVWLWRVCQSMFISCFVAGVGRK